MDDRNLNRETLKHCKKKFRGHEVLYSKYDPRVPESVEREYIRLTNEYMKLLKDELERELPNLKEVYLKNRKEDFAFGIRRDSATDVQMAVSEIFSKIQNRIIRKVSGFDLRGRLELLANMNRKLTVKEWKKAIKATLGVDIREDYYLGDFYADGLIQWIDGNVDLIKTIPEETLDKMRDIVNEGYNKGKTTTRMTRDIQAVYGVSKRRARFIARDQVAKLNGQIQKAQQEDAGITEYIWSSSGDERVRDSHRHLNGNKYQWADPPENSDGRKCHPGQDYGCRCVGRPVFNQSTINLPLDDSVKVSIS